MKESNAVTSAKTKQITPEVLEEAIEWLESETYCCHALACALSGYEYESFHTESNHIKQASEFLEPLLQRDGISDTGTWTVCGTVKSSPSHALNGYVRSLKNFVKVRLVLNENPLKYFFLIEEIFKGFLVLKNLIARNKFVWL